MLTYGHSGKPKDLVSSSLPCAALASPSYGLQDALHRPRVTDGRTLSGYLLTSLTLPWWRLLLLINNYFGLYIYICYFSCTQVEEPVNPVRQSSSGGTTNNLPFPKMP